MWKHFYVVSEYECFIYHCMHDHFFNCIHNETMGGGRERKCSVGGGLIFFAWKGEKIIILVRVLFFHGDVF